MRRREEEGVRRVGKKEEGGWREEERVMREDEREMREKE